MKIILLLAGQSNRFWPLKEKPLFALLGKTVFEHQVECINQAGFTDIHCIVSKQNKAELEVLQPELQYSVQSEGHSGMHGALLHVLEQLNDQPVCIVSGNDIIEPKLISQVCKAVQTCDGALAAKEVEQYFPGGYLELEQDRLTRIIEKPGEGNEPSNLVNLVVHAHKSSKNLLQALQQVQNTHDDGYELALADLFTQQHYVAVPYTGTWAPIKYPWHVLDVLDYKLQKITGQHIDTTAQIHTSATITGDVYIGKQVKIMPNATIAGPCFIGDHAVVGNNALVRNSSIGTASVVGYGTEVARSSLGNNVWTHTNYIGDSVIGNNVSFGAGTITGNVRLDEALINSVVKEQRISTLRTKLGTIIGSNCRLGINTSIAPGVKIGSGTFVSSAVYVDQDLPEHSFARLKHGELKVSPNHTLVPNAAERSSTLNIVKN
jgi:UDP-N-acetylglucosamine diphosphorylase / glucose-1-phosphate thymidylyltransferase / UDP-N-acetylgalactosamine diphosphorylase / glucosamine-1-phosphate N-acetyltransferase / galactosamine-1-phosphate N-acetyltransferase